MSHCGLTETLVVLSMHSYKCSSDGNLESKSFCFCNKILALSGNPGLGWQIIILKGVGQVLIGNILQNMGVSKI